MTRIKETAFTRRSRNFEAVGDELDRLELVEDAPSGKGEEQDAPFVPSRSFKLAIRLAAGRSLEGRYLVRTETITRGRGLATAKLVRRSLIDPATGEVAASLFEKLLREGARESVGRFGWYREALVYADDLLSRGTAGIRVPRCYEIEMPRAGEIHLYLEDLSGLQHPLSRDRRLRAAEALGRFGAWAAQEKAHQRFWLRSTGRKFNPPQHSPVEEVVRALVATETAVQKICSGFALMRSEMRRLNVLRQSLQPTVCHVDTHLWNVFVDPDGDEVVLIDWARVSRGFLGEDLGKLLSPFRSIAWQGMSYEAFRADEEAMVEGYLAGIAKAGGSFDVDKVRTAYDLTVVVNSLHRLADPASIRRWPLRAAAGTAERRRPGLETYLLDLADRAERLVAAAR